MNTETGKFPQLRITSEWLGKKEIMLSAWRAAADPDGTGKRSRAKAAGTLKAKALLRRMDGEKEMNQARIRLKNITIYPADEAVLLKVVADRRMNSVEELCKDIIANYCVELRTAKRLQAQPHHYTARHAEDYEDAE